MLNLTVQIKDHCYQTAGAIYSGLTTDDPRQYTCQVQHKKTVSDANFIISMQST